jgi:LysM repeat protein
LLIALGLVGGFIALVLIALLLGGGGDDGAGEADSSPTATAVVTAAPTTRPTTRPTSAPTAASTTSPTADPTRTGEPVLDDIRILYEVQPGERLEAIAAHFGIKRRRIIRANEGMVDAVPQVETGQVIIIPVPEGTSIEEITSLAGFDSFVEGPGT